MKMAFCLQYKIPLWVRVSQNGFIQCIHTHTCWPEVCIYAQHIIIKSQHSIVTGISKCEAANITFQ